MLCCRTAYAENERRTRSARIFLRRVLIRNQKETQPVVDDRPRFRGRVVSLGAAWIGSIICGTKWPSIGNLPKRPKTPPIKQELLDLAAICEEVANNIEDRMPGG
jgi:hypothetical protein